MNNQDGYRADPDARRQRTMAVRAARRRRQAASQVLRNRLLRNAG